MSVGPILITSFQTWRSHQLSNSSDDLIAALMKSNQLPTDAAWLRHVPVNFQLASIRVISQIQRLRPRVVICCGMAESRTCLSIESQAKGFSGGAFSVLQTTANTAELIADTLLSEISYDAGSYVCNRLYYDVLDFTQTAAWATTGIFIHVPVLSKVNKPFVLSDFAAVVAKLGVKKIGGQPFRRYAPTCI